MGEVRLIPFEVEEVMTKIDERVPRGIQMINSPKVWEESRYGEDAVVAILDTGCDVNHPELKDRIIDGRNFTNDYGGDPNKFNDNHFHGTHVAGTVCAADNDMGLVGVAPKAKILALKVLDENGSGSYQGIIEAIKYATEWRGKNNEKVNVISMSLGGPRDIPELHEAIKDAVGHDVLVVCAAGNAGDGKGRTPETGYPGYYKEVVQVGAINFKREIAKFSNTNDEIDLVAPGVDIISTYPGNKYAKLSGTSMATPHVSGAAALIINGYEKAFGRKITGTKLFAQLCKQTVSIGHSKTEEGNGLLHLTPYEAKPKAYAVTSKPLGDGYSVEVGFHHKHEEAVQAAEALAQDLQKGSGEKVETKHYEYAPASKENSDPLFTITKK